MSFKNLILIIMSAAVLEARADITIIPVIAPPIPPINWSLGAPPPRDAQEAAQRQLNQEIMTAGAQLYPQLMAGFAATQASIARDWAFTKRCLDEYLAALMNQKGSVKAQAAASAARANGTFSAAGNGSFALFGAIGAPLGNASYSTQLATTNVAGYSTTLANMFASVDSYGMLSTPQYGTYSYQFGIPSMVAMGIHQESLIERGLACVGLCTSFSTDGVNSAMHALMHNIGTENTTAALISSTAFKNTFQPGFSFYEQLDALDGKIYMRNNTEGKEIFGINVDGIKVESEIGGVVVEDFTRANNTLVDMLWDAPGLRSLLASNGVTIQVYATQNQFLDSNVCKDFCTPGTVSVADWGMNTIGLMGDFNPRALVHEVGHLVDNYLILKDPGLSALMDQAYTSAKANTWYANPDTPGMPSYSQFQRGEYVAELSAIYHGAKKAELSDEVHYALHGRVFTNEELAAHDPQGYAIMEKIYNIQPLGLR